MKYFAIKFVHFLFVALLVFLPVKGFAADPNLDFTDEEAKELKRLERLLGGDETAPAPAKKDDAAAAEKREKAEAARMAAEKRKKAEATKIAAEKRKKAEATKIAAEKRKTAEATRIAEEKRKTAEATRIAEEKRKTEEAARKAEASKKAAGVAGVAGDREIRILQAEIGIMKLKQAAMARKLQGTEARLKQPETIEVGGLNFDLSGNLETQLRFTGKDIADDSSDSTTTISASTVEIGLETTIGNLATGSIVFLTEDIGDEDAGDDAGEAVLIDEAIITLQKEGSPVYVVLGSRTQPFGAFYTHTISDPLTQDFYEIGEAGITIGTQFSKGDVSITLYRGQGHRDHLLDSGHYNNNTDDLDWTAMTDGVNSPTSIILSGQFSVIPEWNVGFSYSNEKGEESNNSTLGVNMDYARGKWTLELEYIMALSRDKYAGATEEYKESAGSLGFSFMTSEALEVAVRYEMFNAGDFVDDTGGWAISNIIVIGANYTITSDEESGTDIYTAVEFRSFSYDVDDSLTGRADSNTELTVVLGIDF